MFSTHFVFKTLKDTKQGGQLTAKLSMQQNFKNTIQNKEKVSASYSSALQKPQKY